MTAVPIRDALREAGEAARRSLYPGMCRDGACMLAPCACADAAAAAAVAAFLRVIARQHVEDCDRDGVPGDPMGVGAWLDDIAAAVEAAGREGE